MGFGTHLLADMHERERGEVVSAVRLLQRFESRKGGVDYELVDVVAKFGRC